MSAYRRNAAALASREASKMRGQLVKSTARVVLVAGLLGGAIAITKRRK